MAIVQPAFAEDTTNGTIEALPNSPANIPAQFVSGGQILPNSSSTTVWLGPSVLAIFKNIAIEGGVQGPLFRDVSESVYGRERIRFAINLSYLKYSSHTSSH